MIFSWCSQCLTVEITFVIAMIRWSEEEMLYNKWCSKLIRTEQLCLFQLEIQLAEKTPASVTLNTPSLWNTPSTPVIKLTPRSWWTSRQWVPQSHTRESRVHKRSQLTEPREMKNAKMTWNHSNVQVPCKGKMWNVLKQWQMMHWTLQPIERFSGSAEQQENWPMTDTERSHLTVLTSAERMWCHLIDCTSS